MTQRIIFQLAQPQDDGEIRQLLRSNPVGGDVQFSFEREPSYFDYSGIEGNFHQTLIAREEADNSLVGMASRGIRSYYVDGKQMEVGYLSQLRFTPAHRNLYPLKKGFHFLRQLHRDGRTPLYLTSIMAGNSSAERILQSAVEGLPRYREYCTFITHVLSTRKKFGTKLQAPLNIEACRREHLPALFSFLHQTNREYQFSPVWDEETLFSEKNTPGLSISDFFLALEDGRIVGCAGLWDQRQFKQSIVRGYSPIISRFRPLLNLGARLTGSPPLPPKNEILSHSYLSHITLSENRADVFDALLVAALDKARSYDTQMITFGFAENHPLHGHVLDSIKTLRSKSTIFLVYWPEDGELPPFARSTRTPGIEIALL